MMTESSSLEIKHGAHLLIVLTGALGDIARGAIVPAQIRKQRPDLRLSWLVERRWREIVELHSSIDEIFTFDRKAPLGSLYRLRKELRSAKIDIALDMQRIAKSGLLATLSGAAVRIGAHRKNSKEFNWLFQSLLNRYVPDSISKLHFYTEFLRTLGVKTPSGYEFGFQVDRQARELKEKYPILQEPFLMIVLGSSWSSKNWVAEGYDQLVAGLLKRYPYRLILAGDRSQTGLADQLVSSYQGERLFSLTGETSLVELVALCSLCVAGVGPDSGPAHLCSAFQRPYITLFGPTDPARVVAWGAQDLVCRAEIACAPCMKRECPGLDRLCLRLISPEQVLHKIGSAISVRTD